MKMLRVVLAAIVFAVGVAMPVARATDGSDLYWNPNESGWGMQLVERGGIIFATLYVYAFDGSPTWYAAGIVPQAAPGTWSGNLYTGTGPWFGAVPFDPQNVKANKVGTLTWVKHTVETGTLTYDVNGVTVTKFAVREPLVDEVYSGTYSGAWHVTASQCTNPALNGTVEMGAVLLVNQSGKSVDLMANFVGGLLCTFSGKLDQYGQMAQVRGNYTCNNGDNGKFTLFELQVYPYAITGAITTSESTFGCQDFGWFGAMRRAN